MENKLKVIRSKFKSTNIFWIRRIIPTINDQEAKYKTILPRACHVSFAKSFALCKSLKYLHTENSRRTVFPSDCLFKMSFLEVDPHSFVITHFLRARPFRDHLPVHLDFKTLEHPSVIALVLDPSLLNLPQLGCITDNTGPCRSFTPVCFTVVPGRIVGVVRSLELKLVHSWKQHLSALHMSSVFTGSNAYTNYMGYESCQTYFGNSSYPETWRKKVPTWNIAKADEPELAPESCVPVPVTCVISYSIT